MTFQLVYYSQQDPQWKSDLLGFGDPGDTIGYVGCAMTSVAMLLSGHGFPETPKTLNRKLQNANGFVSAAIRWDVVSQVCPKVTLKSSISCVNTDAPLGLIDASLAAGQPVIVMVDSTPVAGLQTHWVVLYAKEGNDYLMLDPWPYQPDVKKKTYLMPRYSQGNPLKRSIMHVIIYEAFNASGGVFIPDGTTKPAEQTQPAHVPVSSNDYIARVKAEAGINIRSSMDTSSPANIVVSVPQGTNLVVLSADDYAKIGGVNQWARVRDTAGHEGFAAAWYLEKVSAPQTTPAAQPDTFTETTTTDSTPTSESTSESAPKPEKEKIYVVVKGAGAIVYKFASKKSEVFSKEMPKAVLKVLEAPAKAAPKIGVAGTWIQVKASNGRRGFVDGGQVKKG